MCFIFIMTTFSFSILSAQEKADSLHLLRPLSLPPADTLVVVSDTIRVDTVSGDSVKPDKPLFKDIISYDAEDSIRFSIEQKKVYLYGNANVKYLKTELNAQFIELDMDKKQAFASGMPDTSGTLIGTPKFKDGGQEFESKEL